MPFESNGRGRAGYDCWGFFRLLYDVYFGIELPAYEMYETNADFDVVASELVPWHEVTELEFGDGLMFSVPTPDGTRPHIGFYCWPRNMFHIHKGINSCRMPYTSKRLPYRLIGSYRHPKLFA